MIRLALDSDQPGALLGSFPFLMTYSDIVPDLPALQAKFPASTVLLIDRGLGDPGKRATIADVEPGALTPADMPRWLDERQGVPYLTAYSDRNDLPAVREAIGDRACWHWVATLDGTCFVEGYPPFVGPALVQVLGADKLGIHADLSIVLNPGWHPAPHAPVSQAVAADLHELRTTQLQLAEITQRLLADVDK